LVRTLVEGSGSPGYCQASWDGRDDTGRSVASGVYLYRLEAGRTASVRKLLLLQ
jgi:flagellar hook assembly protein FlgD